MSIPIKFQDEIHSEYSKNYYTTIFIYVENQIFFLPTILNSQEEKQSWQIKYLNSNFNGSNPGFATSSFFEHFSY